MVEKSSGLRVVFIESRRFWIRVGIEYWFVNRAAAGPETATAHLMRSASTATKRATFVAPGWGGAGRPENRVTAKSKAPQKK